MYLKCIKLWKLLLIKLSTVCLLSSRMKRHREHNEKEDFTSKITENHQNIVFNTIILVAKLHHTINLRILINTYMIN